MHNPTPASDNWRKSPGKKDTRAWCRGRVGREHTPEVRMRRWPYRPEQCGMVWDVWPWTAPDGHHSARRPNRWACFHEKYCSTCGKVFYDLKSEDCPTKPKDVK